MDDPVLTARIAKRLGTSIPALPIIARARDATMPPRSIAPA